MPGEVDGERRAEARFAVNVDETLVLFDDAEHRGKPQSRSLPQFLGREKRLGREPGSCLLRSTRDALMVLVWEDVAKT